MERQALHDRFITLTWQEQLGNIASTLGKISQQVNIPEQDKLTTFLLREGALMIEWCASNVPADYHLELAGLQKELLAWKESFSETNARQLLALHLSNQRERLLEMSGLLTKGENLAEA
ncbi:hypothetical protein [Dactylococcopsis salina]|uniref:Uncharacterized protein n=1 Tax=Dactylococcopsis salina (strain PCC 8305) TaxID=13035 RepID=K9YT01_DACS8|nr:hypothetical protein [Dactylococcopsis salina]AFZ49203.1 hypothetical protein Dacsa_0414 [Dactylococcopsis salina PCC 8305]